MTTRHLSGRVLLPDGTALASGMLSATPLYTMPSETGEGVLAPVPQQYTITNGNISGSIISPCYYRFEVRQGVRLLWRFEAPVAESASPVTLDEIYRTAAGSVIVIPPAIISGDNATALGSGSADEGDVLTADGQGGTIWSPPQEGSGGSGLASTSMIWTPALPLVPSSGPTIISLTPGVDLRILDDGSLCDGDGSEDDPWTGWDLRSWDLDSKRYALDQGWYAFDTSPAAWTIAAITGMYMPKGLQLVGQGEHTVLKHTGAGIALDHGGSTVDGAFTAGHLEGFVICGNLNTSIGMRLRAWHMGVIREVRVRDVTDLAFEMQHTVACEMTSLCCSSNFQRTFLPAHGLRFTQQPVSTNYSTTCSLVRPYFSGLQTGIGIELTGFGHTLVSGASENNAVGLKIAGGTHVISGTAFELNQLGDVIALNGRSVFQGCEMTSGTYQIYSGCTMQGCFDGTGNLLTPNA